MIINREQYISSIFYRLTIRLYVGVSFFFVFDHVKRSERDFWKSSASERSLHGAPDRQLWYMRALQSQPTIPRSYKTTNIIIICGYDSTDKKKKPVRKIRV